MHSFSQLYTQSFWVKSVSNVENLNLYNIIKFKTQTSYIRDIFYSKIHKCIIEQKNASKSRNCLVFIIGYFFNYK